MRHLDPILLLLVTLLLIRAVCVIQSTQAEVIEVKGGDPRTLPDGNYYISVSSRGAILNKRGRVAQMVVKVEGGVAKWLSPYPGIDAKYPVTGPSWEYAIKIEEKE